MPAIGWEQSTCRKSPRGTAGGGKLQWRKYMTESTRLGRARGKMLPVAIVTAALVAMLAIAPLASAASDPISSGTTTLTINKGFSKQAKQAGIKITLKSEPFNTIEATVGNCTQDSHPASTCSWQLVDFGYLSSGLEPDGVGIFNTNGYVNTGGYSNPEMDTLINATEYSSSASALSQYENYAAEQLPQF